MTDSLGFSWVYKNSTHKYSKRHAGHFESFTLIKDLLSKDKKKSLLFKMTVSPPPSTYIKIMNFLTGTYPTAYTLANPYVYNVLIH
jgi:hypothetical protein